MGPKMAPESAGKLFGGVMGKPWARNDPFLGLFWAHFGPYPAPPFGTYLGMNQVVGAPKVVQKGVQNRPQKGSFPCPWLAHDPLAGRPPPGWPTPPNDPFWTLFGPLFDRFRCEKWPNGLQKGPQKGSFLAHDPPGWPTPPK